MSIKHAHSLPHYPESSQHHDQWWWPAWRVIRITYEEFVLDNCLSMAASVACYAMFSLPPLLVLIITLLDATYGTQSQVNVTEQLKGQMHEVIGGKAADQVERMIHEPKPMSTSFATLVSIAALLFGATGAFVELQHAINTAWGIEPDPERGGLSNFVLKRLLSFGMVFVIAFLLLISLVITTMLNEFGVRLQEWIPTGFTFYLVSTMHWLFSVAVVILLFAAMFKFLPDAHVAWRDVMLGAALTAILFTAAKYVLGVYLSGMDNSAYTGAASIVLVLIWIYYSSLIVMLGAEFTQVWARLHGKKLIPRYGAVRIVQKRELVHAGREIPQARESHVPTIQERYQPAEPMEAGEKPGAAHDEDIEPPEDSDESSTRPAATRRHTPH